MSKVKSFRLVILTAIASSILFPFIGQSSTKNGGEKRPDMVLIELGSELSKNEMPGVAFLHDLHTQALEGKCLLCHQETKDGVVFTFNRTDQDPSMEIYHEGCISCHREKKSSSQSTGPMADQCGSCHIKEPVRTSSRMEMDFHRSLHFIHEQSKEIKARDTRQEENCSACHHREDEKTKQLVFPKGEEASCFYCHESGEKDGVRAMRNAAHDSCVKCHQSLKAKALSAGPVECAGCHDKAEQAKIEKQKEIPRLKRNQPDQVLLTRASPDPGAKAQGFMPAVAFDHRAHEAAQLSCKACHHQTLKKCSECHDVKGSEEKGGGVSLARAMHERQNAQSCIGCHETFTKGSDCAGCHAQMPVKKQDPRSCETCHSIPLEQVTQALPDELVKGELAGRASSYTLVPREKIPEVVVIDALVDEYKASQFPHGKVVRAIMERAEKSPMAKTFHKDQAGLCMGCHHNGPKTLEPPKCGSCHSKNGPALDGRPGLKGAFHGQCITCHQDMKVTHVAATDCVKCHEKKEP